MIRQVEFQGETPACGLHFVDPAGSTHLVEPWLMRRRCCMCRHQETYIIDRYLPDGAIMYKSLEYGHEFDGSEFRDDLSRVGVDLPSLRQ